MRPRRFLAQEARLTISPAMAYGHEGVGGHRNCRKGSAELPPKIPPDATLIFDVDFVSFECKDCGKNVTALHRKSMEFKSWAGFLDSVICIYVDVGRVCLLMIMYTYIVITHMMLHMMYVYHCYVSCQAQANFAQKHGSTREAVNQ